LREQTLERCTVGAFWRMLCVTIADEFDVLSDVSESFAIV
jgi:hypothetical protein